MVESPAPEGAPTAPVLPAAQIRRPGRDLRMPVDVNAGRAGRERAQATVAAELAGRSQALSSALDGLSSSLASGPGGAGTGSAAGDEGGVGAAPGVYRSNASLLAAIQKYAAGIRYCYTNELKHDPTLKGKLVFGIAVAAKGDVTEATVVENSLRSSRLTSCALSQVREWKFPPVPRGVTSFQVPFVFTPPQ